MRSVGIAPTSTGLWDQRDTIPPARKTLGADSWNQTNLKRLMRAPRHLADLSAKWHQWKESNPRLLFWRQPCYRNTSLIMAEWWRNRTPGLSALLVFKTRLVSPTRYALHFYLNLVDQRGIEPPTLWMQIRCSPNWATGPKRILFSNITAF